MSMISAFRILMESRQNLGNYFITLVCKIHLFCTKHNYAQCG